MEEKKKKMSEATVMNEMDRFFDRLDIGVKERKDHCQFRLRSGKRYCSATTHNSCQNCQMFTPTTQSKIRLLVEYLLKAEKNLTQKKREITLKDKRISELQDEVFKLSVELQRLQEGEDYDDEETFTERQDY